MFAKFKKQVFALPLALGLVGATFAALPATSADAAPRSFVVKEGTKINNNPTLKTTKIAVRAGEPSVYKIPGEDKDGDALSYSFIGRPIAGISIQGEYLVVDLPKTQRAGLHRVQLRVSDKKNTGNGSVILNILNDAK